MPSTLPVLALLVGATAALSARAGGQATAPAAQGPALQASASAGTLANRAVYLDDQGVVRWKDNRQEVALFGSNYVIHTASDYRAAGYVGGDRKKMIDEDVAHFARMGWDGLRLTFWGDWEASDSAGNLLSNDHLDLLDYLVARARERGIYMLFSPIQLYGSNWPDALGDTTQPGFGRKFGKGRMGTDPAAIAAQVNYLRQILQHVNPYTGVALKDEPAILFIELVNEPWHHPEDMPGSVRYIDALTDAVRSTGCTKLVFHNVSQDFRIGEAIRRSRAQGVTFAWYPTGLNSGHELEGNYLRAVDSFPDMLRPELARLPRIVYEFDSPDLRTGTMYPAMVRTFRSVGAQFAAMFAYDMLGTASRNLGWQTHYLNLVYTPRKAMSAIIAAEAMRRLPRMRTYGPYPQNTRFGPFRVDAAADLGELAAPDALLYAGSTTTAPATPAALRRVAGYGSSPVVRYEGEGVYFLDRVRKGLWRLEVYPDAVPVADPFEQPSADKVVTRAIYRAWPMTIDLPDLGESFTIQPLAAGNASVSRAAAGRFDVRPGVYVLSGNGPVDPGRLPTRLGALGFQEFHAPPADSLPPTVVNLTLPQLLTGRAGVFRARVVDDPAPDSVKLYLRPVGSGFFRAFRMERGGAYEYAASVPAAALRQGPIEYVVTSFRGVVPATFPSGLPKRPTDWDYYSRGTWTAEVVDAHTPLRLFSARDIGRLAFTRIGDAGRQGLFRVLNSGATGQPVFHLELPVNVGGISPAHYTASLVVQDRIAARQETMAGATELRLRLRGLGPRQTLHVTLVEADGTPWTGAVQVDSTWSERSLPLSDLEAGRGVLLPQAFPGEWSYWAGPAAGRGGPGDRPRRSEIQRLQLSLRREEGAKAAAGSYGVEVEWVTLGFRAPAPAREAGR